MADVLAKPTKEQIEEGLKLLQKKMIRDDKIKKGLIKGTTYKKSSELTPEQLKKRRELTARMTARNSILIAKARKAGITVTDAEVEAELKKKA
jgi:hypothetical protein